MFPVFFRLDRSNAFGTLGIAWCVVDVILGVNVLIAVVVASRGGVARESGDHIVIACQFSRYVACAPLFSPFPVVAAVCCVCALLWSPWLVCPVCLVCPVAAPVEPQ